MTAAHDLDPPKNGQAIRLAMVLPDMRRAGAESVVAALCRSLAHLGVEVHLVVIGPRCEYQDELANSGVHIHRLALYEQGPIRFYRQDRHWRIRRQLWHFFRTLKPDIAHFHLMHSLVWGGAAARAAGAKTLYTAHGRDPCLTADDLPSRWRRLLYTRAIAAARCRLLAVSPSVAHHQAQGLQQQPHTILIQPNPVDLTACHPAPYRSTLPERAIMVGTLYPLKRVHMGLLALRAWLEQAPAAELWVAGDGAERSRLEHQAQQPPLAGRVTFLGVRRDVPELLHAAGVVWLLSEQEGMPMVALEAMASGIPLIATQVFGTRDLVQHEVNGLLVPLDQPEAVAQATHRLWLDSELRQRLVAGGLATVRRYETGRIAKEHLAHYQQLLRDP
ncbi:MAG: glycosyltransferase family 4 protein [Magnetococcales bacterium]|nr:glycosyltransferase family 4 protein [Magnetococcales bacterium]